MAIWQFYGQEFLVIAINSRTRKSRRAQLQKLSFSDVVTVTRIDHLARSTFDLFGIVKQIVDAKVQFRSLAEPWADTGTSTGRLMLAVLGGLADVERDLIRTRTAEGRSRAKARRQQMGRPSKHAAAAERSTAAAGRGRDAHGTGEKLQRRPGDNFEDHGIKGDDARRPTESTCSQ